MYEFARHHEDGQVHIFRTDSELEMLRYEVDQTVRDFEMSDHVTVSATDAGDGWTRVDLVYSSEADPNELTQLEDGIASLQDHRIEFREEGYVNGGNGFWVVLRFRTPSG